VSSAAPDLAQVGYHDDFYGFRDVPFHVHLGMRFERPDPAGPAVVTLPAQSHLLEPDGRQSMAAVYAVGEVASGISVCDALLLHAAEAESALMPLVLTKRAVFTPMARPYGDVRSRTACVGDASAAAEKLRASRKVKVEVEGELLGDGDEVAGRIHVYFYVRLMELSRLEAMAGELMPAMANRAREVLGGTAAR
jgi:hypothetical protein